MTTADLPRTIAASIHQAAIAKVSDFFNATLRDIFNELLQNSRRAGATRVEVHRDGDRITLTDDGQGIPDPAALLAFGRSDWHSADTLDENPAGMGLYSLARSPRTVITSAPRHGPAWQVVLTPPNFTGEEPAEVLQPDPPPASAGTSITFHHRTADLAALRNQLQEAARHCPVPVNLDGEPLNQESFLTNAVHTEYWNGLTIGVRTHPTPRDMNFHGIVIRDTGIPKVPTLTGHWSAAVDVDHCPDLRLTLPSRKELVKTPFLERLYTQCQAVIYRAMLAAPHPVDIPKEVQDHARTLGIHLPGARPRLQPWQPELADDHEYEPQPSPVETSPASVIVDMDLPIPDQHVLARMAGRTGVAHRLMQADPRLEGYAWYDALDRADHMTVTLHTGQETVTVDHIRQERLPAPAERPDSIRVLLTGASNDGARALRLSGDTDLALLRDGTNCSLDYAEPAVTKDTGLQTHELAGILLAGHFTPYEDTGADSYDTQKEAAEDEAYRRALLALKPKDEALAGAIAQIFQTKMLYELPQGYETVITVARPPDSPSQVDVQLRKLPGEQPNPAPTE